MRFHDSFLTLLDTEAKQKIVRFLLKHDAPMSEREIASIAGISHMTINRTLRELEKWGLVYYERIGRAHVWKVNRKSYPFAVLKTLQEQIESISAPFDELKNDVLRWLPQDIVHRAVLFGSVAKAEEEIDSDIDLFLLVKNKDSVALLEGALERLSIQCLEKFGNRLAPYILTENEFRQKKNSALIAEISKGIQLFPSTGR